jgi:hypothetical protein
MTTPDAEIRGFEHACDLPSDRLRDRVAMIRRDVLPHATRREALADGFCLEFEHSPAMQKTLEDLVAFERECCSGLAWSLRRPSDRVLRLSVEGLTPDSDFFLAVGGATDPSVDGRLARLAQASGLGALAGFSLCCIVPIGVAAVAGASVAAPLAKLDDPLVISAASVVLALPAWLWLKRRATRSAEASCADGC